MHFDSYRMVRPSCVRWIVNFLAWATNTTSDEIRGLQSGQVQQYAYVFLLRRAINGLGLITAVKMEEFYTVHKVCKVHKYGCPSDSVYRQLLLPWTKRPAGVREPYELYEPYKLYRLINQNRYELFIILRSDPLTDAGRVVGLARGTCKADSCGGYGHGALRHCLLALAVGLVPLHVFGRTGCRQHGRNAVYRRHSLVRSLEHTLFRGS